LNAGLEGTGMITREIATQIRADALELIQIAPSVKDEVAAAKLEAIATAMLKRALALENDPRF
jgi:hypothetical protein